MKPTSLGVIAEMQENVIDTSSSLVLSQETLRAFAKGQLDEATEQRVLAVLETRPDLAAKVAAISSDSILKKMKPHGQSPEPISLASQLTSVNQVQADAKPANYPLNSPPELAEVTDFKIIKEIGRGGMGVVYLAEHLLTGRKEVLKVLNERLMTNSEARKRFDQEIKCIAAMNHETIVRCYTFQQLPSAIVLCMEYVPGTNLHQFIHTNGPLPIHVACGIVAEVCRGLQHAMENGLVHRDIKPSNIMLYKSEGKIKAKILDFGLARLDAREQGRGLTDDGTLLGTLEYISPEQCLNAAAADIRSDIYSLGCTLYHMLVGHPPFSGSTGELVLAHAQVIPPAINLIRPEVPNELAGFVSQMLAKQSHKRPSTPAQVADNLKRYAKRKHVDKSVPTPVLLQQASIDTSVVPQQHINTPFEAKSNDSIRPPSRPQKSRRNRWRRTSVILVAIFAVLLSMPLVISSPMGTIVISNLPEDATVLIDGNSVLVQRSNGQGKIRVEQGDREISIVRTGLTLLETKIQIIPGNEQTIKIETETLAAKSQTREQQTPRKTSTKLPDLSHIISKTASFQPLMSATTSPQDHFNIGGIAFTTDAVANTISIHGAGELNTPLSTKRQDFRNFHLRIEMQIASLPEAGKWNQFFLLRGSEHDSAALGWRFSLGGNRPHPGVLHEIAPFGIMDFKVKPFRGYPRGIIGIPHMKRNRIEPFLSEQNTAMSRDEFHFVEYIAHGAAVDAFLDGKFICSATDALDRADIGSIAMFKDPEALDVFREFSILELQDDETAERYARTIALALSKD